MDQVKIGKFIAERRREMGLTQASLAESLGITDRAVSKWERGLSMPDSAIMLDLCKLLQINANDLLCGEVVSMERYNEESERLLIEMVKEKEKTDKAYLIMQIVFMVPCIAILLTLCVIAAYAELETWLRVLLIVIGFLPVATACPFLLKIEQLAGYYECANCGHRYVPSYKSVFLSMHLGRTRYMQCPVCEKRSWHKKRISKED